MTTTNWFARFRVVQRFWKNKEEKGKFSFDQRLSPSEEPQDPLGYAYNRFMTVVSQRFFRELEFLTSDSPRIISGCNTLANFVSSVGTKGAFLLIGEDSPYSLSFQSYCNYLLAYLVYNYILRKKKDYFNTYCWISILFGKSMCMFCTYSKITFGGFTHWKTTTLVDSNKVENFCNYILAYLVYKYIITDSVWISETRFDTLQIYKEYSINNKIKHVSFYTLEEDEY